MARPMQPLQKRYGRLEVTGSAVVGGRRYATVVCDCGAEKSVLAHALRAGRTQSCGALDCRPTATTITPDPNYKPRGPQALSRRKLRTAYTAFASRRKSAATLATHYGVNYNTLYSLLRNVRKAGGIDAYLAAVRSN